MAIVGINQSLLTSWYTSRVTTATVASSSLAQSAASSRNRGGEDVAAPWELESKNLQTLEEMRRRVMATQDFFLDPS